MDEQPKLSCKERDRQRFLERQAKQASDRKATRRLRRDMALYRHAKLVYDYDRDFNHEFSNE